MGLFNLGILLGVMGIRELGWGGWWFWDPVENASYAWFAGAACPSLAVTDKECYEKLGNLIGNHKEFFIWDVFSSLGRTNVRAPFVDPTRGVFILIMTAGIIGGCFGSLRASTTSLNWPNFLLSQKSLLLVNNVVMTAALSVVMIGTLTPLLLKF